MANRIFSIIGWVGTALVFASLAMRFGMPAQDRYAYYLALGGLACMLVYMASQWRDIAAFFGRRQARYGTLAASSVLIVLGILVAVNYIGSRQNKRWDLTAAKQFSLSDQSRNVLAKLDSPLQLMVFTQNTEFQPFQDRLREYEYSSKQVATEYIDPDQKQSIAKQYQVQQYGTIVINYKGRTERVTSNSEQEITNGIIKVVSGEQRKVYFTQGHGEKDTTSADREGFSGISEALKRENYTVEKTVLAQQGAVPEDASMVVIAGPKNDFLAPEVDALKKYLDKQGKLLLMLDPPDGPDSKPLTNLVGLAHEWGLDVGTDLVLDVSGMGKLFGASEAMPVAAGYPSHPITDRFSVMTVFPLSRSVTPVSGGVNGHTAQPVVQTSERSWAEANLKSVFAQKELGLDPKEGDKAGPITVAAAVSAAVPAPPADPTKPDPNANAPKPETRIAVYGDSDFPANSYLGFAGNRDLFMNTVGWLSQQENLIAIRPKEADDRRLTMTATQQNNLVWLSLVIIPGLVIATGVYSWYRRR
jgi:ABC-type uncharacterized transport system involved in gliding motility auxiliary subunit